MAQQKQDEYGTYGFQYIEVMTGDDLEAQPTPQSDLQQWQEDAQMLTIPTLDAYNFSDWGVYEVDFGTPSITHIGPEMQILSIDEGIEDPNQFMDTP